MRLSRAAEFRDPETGAHIQRMSNYSRLIAAGLGLPDDYYEAFRSGMQARHDRLRVGLAAAGLDVLASDGTYFVTVDIRSIGESDGLAFCRSLPERCGVVAVPSRVFYADPDAGAMRPQAAYATGTGRLSGSSPSKRISTRWPCRPGAARPTSRTCTCRRGPASSSTMPAPSAAGTGWNPPRT